MDHAYNFLASAGMATMLTASPVAADERMLFSPDSIPFEQIYEFVMDKRNEGVRCFDINMDDPSLTFPFGEKKCKFTIDNLVDNSAGQKYSLTIIATILDYRQLLFFVFDYYESGCINGFGIYSGNPPYLIDSMSKEGDTEDLDSKCREKLFNDEEETLRFLNSIRNIYLLPEG